LGRSDAVEVPSVCVGGVAAPAAFLAPEPLDLLVVDRPALAPGIGIGLAEPAPRMMLGRLTQPGPQFCVGVAQRRRCSFAALRRSLLPGDPAGEPL
jgi:hypothetical protein